MSAAKYANLPDIDLEGHDVYETPDVPPSPTEVESDDEKDAARVRGTANRPGQGELDNEPLPSTETSGRFFRHAERRARRQRELYSYPDSSYSSSRSPSPSRSNLPLSQRIELMKNELANSKPKLRTRLINAMANGKNKDKAKPEADSSVRNVVPHSAQPEIAIHMRIAQLEKLIGASGTSLDEVIIAPAPAASTPLDTDIQSPTLLAQPRHIDSISRRLKLLLTDLERYSASGTPSGPGAPLPPALAELAPSYNDSHHTSRLSPPGLEEDQRRLRAGLADLEEAVKGLEGSISDNSGTITRNVEGLETRISSLEERLAGLSAV
ncbi:dynamitin domain-containing protein [Rhizoctonia solani]|uniref:Dynamitin domain-containing protein n=1 Tax=Rhizoctonia solani TaxID=456999 RepID=A0A8H8T0U7_9AGAM|nr:dynamitin domain-containing protein [Rhizoctonia solani]QRW25109.1 dynamitin domain-containing protein [Rhizoctonia solani]